MAYTFDEFRFETGNLLLQKHSNVIPLAPKTLEVLLTLIEGRGKLITKQEILDKVWAETFVEEANLTHHVSALRKALGEDKNGRKFIETIPRRGYRFVADVSKIGNGTNAAMSAEITISERVTEHFVEEIEENNEFTVNQSINLPPHLGWLTRNRSLIFLAMAILPAVLGGLLFYRFAPQRAENDARRGGSDEPMSYTRVSDGRSVGSTIISPDGKFVAYLQNYNEAGGGAIYLRQLETNREVQLLEPDERTFGNMDFSPDGSLIYYVSFEKNAKIGAIFSIPILGGKPKRLFDLDWASAFFAVSPDGKRIAFYRGDEESQMTSLIVAASDGVSSNEQILHTHPNPEPSFWGFLAWSPNNRYLAVSRVPTSDTQPDSQIFRLDLQTGATVPMTDETFASIGKMCFGADGRELFFIARKDSFRQKIYALDVAARKVRLVVNDEISYGNYGLGITADGKSLAADLLESKADLWSVAANGKTADARRIKRGETDGKRGIAEIYDGSIAYISRTGDKTDIWTVSSDGSNSQMITGDEFQEKDLTASRDGRFLIFSSDRTSVENDKSGSRHLFRMNPDGSDFRQLTFGETKDIQPDCSPDGNWIVYVSEENGSSIIKKVPANGGTPVALTDYFAIHPVFSPDGTRIAVKFMSSSRSQPGEIALIPATGGKPEKTFPVTQFEFTGTTVPIRWTPDGGGIVFKRQTGGAGNLWQQDLNAAAPHQLTDFTADTIFNFAYSTDGSRLLISRGLYQNNAVIIQNF